jgi:hypothetical protein
MLDVAAVGGTLLFFVACRWYAVYCDRLLWQSRPERGTTHERR